MTRIQPENALRADVHIFTRIQFRRVGAGEGIDERRLQLLRLLGVLKLLHVHRLGVQGKETGKTGNKMAKRGYNFTRDELLKAIERSGSV